jgi:thiol-disulfide isomerase/thioredoxin
MVQTWMHVVTLKALWLAVCRNGLLIGVFLIAHAGMLQADVGPDPGAARGEPEFPSEWFMGAEAQRMAHDALVGQPPPPLSVSRWIGEPQDLVSLHGEVVVVEFWATWCVPCVRTLAMNRQLREEYAAEGFVFIGIHDGRRGLERLDRLLAEHNVTCSVGVDDGGKSEQDWYVSFWPTYAVIDRRGLVRAVGLRPEHVPAVVAALIAEPVPAD